MRLCDVRLRPRALPTEAAGTKRFARGCVGRCRCRSRLGHRRRTSTTSTCFPHGRIIQQGTWARSFPIGLSSSPDQPFNIERTRRLTESRDGARALPAAQAGRKRTGGSRVLAIAGHCQWPAQLQVEAPGRTRPPPPGGGASHRLAWRRRRRPAGGPGPHAHWPRASRGRWATGSMKGSAGSRPTAKWPARAQTKALAGAPCAQARQERDRGPLLRNMPIRTIRVMIMMPGPARAYRQHGPPADMIMRKVRGITGECQ
jgi:hypothetical protein